MRKKYRSNDNTLSRSHHPSSSTFTPTPVRRLRLSNLLIKLRAHLSIQSARRILRPARQHPNGLAVIMWYAIIEVALIVVIICYW